MTEDALAGGSVSIGAYESTCLGIVITGLQVIEPGFIIVVIAAVAQGVDACHAARRVNDLAVGVIFVGCYGHAVTVNQTNHIALEIEDVVIIGAVFPTASDRNQMRWGGVVREMLKDLGLC